MVVCVWDEGEEVEVVMCGVWCGAVQSGVVMCSRVCCCPRGSPSSRTPPAQRPHWSVMFEKKRQQLGHAARLFTPDSTAHHQGTQCLGDLLEGLADDVCDGDVVDRGTLGTVGTLVSSFKSCSPSLSEDGSEALEDPLLPIHTLRSASTVVIIAPWRSEDMHEKHVRI